MAPPARASAARQSAPAPITEQGKNWLDAYQRVRARSQVLAEPLDPEDQCIQTMPEVSPTKWHLAHTSWFFETFLLKPFSKNYREFHPRYGYLFNSYYNAVGQMHPRAERGLLSRPTTDEVMAYRWHVDNHMTELLGHHRHSERAHIRVRCELGLHHEQQHQELMLTDIKHVLGSNPLRPAYRDLPQAGGQSQPMQWVNMDGGVVSVGADGTGFAFDNELPRHDVLLQPYQLASRPVTNGEFLAFVEDGGYRQVEHWLSDGWAKLQEQQWRSPLYWVLHEGIWHEMTLGGLRPLDRAAPVAHVSYFEADAFARWFGCRLPTEIEWEHAAQGREVVGNLASSGFLQPMAATGEGLQQLFGDVWEWTQSPYVAYPGFKPLSGQLGEYNGKFMSGQVVLRGGSCVTPANHVRASYRNFFYPHDRWQFSGLRLARDGHR